MKKVLIFGLIIVLIFATLAVLGNISKKKQIEGNPYQKESLDPSTIKLLKDPLYGNLILPQELEEQRKQGESLFVYFFQSNCPGCLQTTPILVPTAEEMGIDLKKFNLLEFREGWADYDIESTPTIVYYQDGKEVDRLNGVFAKEEFVAWFEKQLAQQDSTQKDS